MSRRTPDPRDTELLGRLVDSEREARALTLKLLRVSRALDKKVRQTARHRANLAKYRLEKASEYGRKGFGEVGA